MSIKHPLAARIGAALLIYVILRAIFYSFSGAGQAKAIEVNVGEKTLMRPIMARTFDYDWEIDPSQVVVEEEPETMMTTRLGGVKVTDYDPDIDYISLMYAALDEAMTSENPEMALVLGEIYECQRNLKILDLGLEEKYPMTYNFVEENSLDEIVELLYPHEPYYPYTQAELEKLAALVYAEAGCEFMTDEHQRAVASVVINRAESPDWWPQSIMEVIYADGQYPNTKDATYYDARSYENAKYVLEYGPTTEGVYQNTTRLTRNVVATFSYPGLWKSTTYICK